MVVVHLTHWGRVTHICVGKLTITGSDNGLSPGRGQAVIWTNAEILLIGLLGTKFSEILIKIDTFSLKKMRLKVSSGKWRPFCLGLNVLIIKLSSLYIEFSSYFYFLLIVSFQSLSHCELITDEGIRHLGASACAMESLTVLELDNCPLITDASLEHLMGCQNLERIELYDCQLITRAGIRRLRVSLRDGSW